MSKDPRGIVDDYLTRIARKAWPHASVTVRHVSDVSKHYQLEIPGEKPFLLGAVFGPARAMLRAIIYEHLPPEANRAGFAFDVGVIGRSEIPDPQVRDAADQYEAARKLLAAQGPGSGVLLPSINAAAVAVELYLKCLSAEKVHVPYADGSGVSAVRSEPAIKGHVLRKLFDAISDGLRADLSRAFKESPAATGRDLRDRLTLFEDAFQTTRYPFEPRMDIAAIDYAGLMSLSSFLSSFVATVRSKETIEWE